MIDDDALRRHWDAVIALAKPGHALAPNAPTSTVRNRAWFYRTRGETFPLRGRREVHDRLIAEQRAAAPNAALERRAIILAGPPGAGKGTQLERMLGDRVDQYLVVDADRFKNALLQEALRDGSYDAWLKPPEIRELEGAGERFFPLELASLVHEESSMLAVRLRHESIDAGTNLVVDSVLSNEASALALGRRLETAGYRIEVIDVEVPYEISAGRIAGRWQESYEKALTGENTLGGRWVPSEYAHDVFDGPGGKSKPEAVAQKLAEMCPAVDRYRLWRTTAEGTATTPPVGSWEKDLTRSAGRLIPTAVAASFPTSAAEQLRRTPREVPEIPAANRPPEAGPDRGRELGD